MLAVVLNKVLDSLDLGFHWRICLSNGYKSVRKHLKTLEHVLHKKIKKCVNAMLWAALLSLSISKYYMCEKAKLSLTIILKHNKPDDNRSI